MGHQQIIPLLALALCLLDCNFSFAQTTFDPLSIGIGARALGMGKAAIAVAEDGDTLFNNPAGLGEIDSFQFQSMTGTLLEDVSYTLLGGVFPLGSQSALGIGYVGCFVSGIDIRESNGEFVSRANFGGNIILAGIGKKITDKSSFGLNLKYYFFDGTEINAGDGRGWNIDFGLLQKDIGWLSLGLVGENILSSGKIYYQHGASEELPFNIKVGGRMFLLGSNFRSVIFSPIELSAAIDIKQQVQKSHQLSVNSGLEFSPNQHLVIRGGFDQTNLTAGVTFKLAGLKFHYAFNTLAQYFSLNFDERGWPVEEGPGLYLGNS